MNLKKDGIVLNCPLYLIGQLGGLLEKINASGDTVDL